MKKSKNYTISSGNVFEDLGVKNPEEMLAKAQLTSQINTLIKKSNLTQADAAKLLGVDQPKISDLNNGKISGFSLERLFRFLNILGQSITIKVSKAKPKKKSDVRVSIPTSIPKKHKANHQPHAQIQARKKNK